MNFIFNKEKIAEMLSDFYTSTGVAVTLYDSDFEIVAKSPIFYDCCACIRQKYVDMCNHSDLIHQKIVKETKKSLFYTCHAGIMETITPIIYEDTVIAYMQTGQFRDEENIYSSTKKLSAAAKKYGFDEKELLALYKKLPVISSERLQAQLNIMDIIIKSFWESGLIRYNRSMLSVKIEQYISEHLSEKLYVNDICDRFFISKSSLYRLFSDEFGTTVNDFILKKRLEHAALLLRSRSDLDITRISSICGFTDYNYFIRVFRQRMGTTPLKYRKTAESFAHET